MGNVTGDGESGAFGSTESNESLADVEKDGAEHWLVQTRGNSMVSGTTLLKRRLLEGLGWHVAEIDTRHLGGTSLEWKQGVIGSVIDSWLLACRRL